MWFSFKTHPDLSVGNLLKNVCASMCVRVLFVYSLSDEWCRQ